MRLGTTLQDSPPRLNTPAPGEPLCHSESLGARIVEIARLAAAMHAESITLASPRRPIDDPATIDLSLAAILGRRS